MYWVTGYVGNMRRETFIKRYRRGVKRRETVKHLCVVTLCYMLYVT